MFTCTKCGKKAKTSYERTFGEKPTFEPVGYYCKTCGIFYDAKSKAASRVVYGVAKNDLGGLTAEHETKRIQNAQETYTNAAQSVYENEPAIIEQSIHSAHETMRARRSACR